jgi:hypothetical protein
MKLSLYTAAAFVAGVFVGGWILKDRIDNEAQIEIAEAKGFYKEKANRDFEATVRAFVHQWEGEEAAKELTFKNGKPQIVKLMHTKDEREAIVKENVEAVDVKGAAAEAMDASIALTESLIKDKGYTSYNNLKPVPPSGNTTSTEGVKGAFVISQEEFYDRGLPKQNQITYYEGNDVLVSARGKVVPPDERVLLIGLDTLSKFGEQSGEPNVVYVRNLALGAGVDFEITLDEGEYEAPEV